MSSNICRQYQHNVPVFGSRGRIHSCSGSYTGVQELFELMTDLNPQPTIKPVAAIAIKRAAIVDSGTKEAHNEDTSKNNVKSESKNTLELATRQHASADVAPELYNVNADTQESS